MMADIAPGMAATFSKSPNYLVFNEYRIADPVQYPHLTDPFHIVQIDGSTYALLEIDYCRFCDRFTLNMDNPRNHLALCNAN